MTRHGWTLVELLTTLAILAVLAGILLPLLAQTRHKARSTSCVSQLKQIGAALQQYIQDYDEILVCHWYITPGDSDPNGGYKWMDAVYPYLRNEQVFNCPGSGDHPYRYHKNLRAPGNANYGTYAINHAYFQQTAPLAYSPGSESGEDGVPPRAVSLAELHAPAQTVWIVDGDGSFQFRWSDASNHASRPQGTPPKTKSLVARHAGLANVLWCDGHVTSSPLEALLATNPSNLQKYFTIQND